MAHLRQWIAVVFIFPKCATGGGFYAVVDQLSQFIGQGWTVSGAPVTLNGAGGNTIIRASNDADAATEFEIQLTGIKALTAVDFFL